MVDEDNVREFMDGAIAYTKELAANGVEFSEYVQVSVSSFKVISNYIMSRANVIPRIEEGFMTISWEGVTYVRKDS